MAYRKYNNQRVEYDGRVFDSLKEYRRYRDLKLMQRSGLISDLHLQVPFELVPAVYDEVEVQLKTKVKMEKKCVQRSIRYIADFVYMKDGKMIVEDTKGFRTKEYELKKKMMRALLGVEIKEI